MKNPKLTSIIDISFGIILGTLIARSIGTNFFVAYNKFLVFLNAKIGLTPNLGLIFGGILGFCSFVLPIFLIKKAISGEKFNKPRVLILLLLFAFSITWGVIVFYSLLLMSAAFTILLSAIIRLVFG